MPGPPRVVVVTRSTEYEALLVRHATHGQARFFLETRGREIESVEEDHRRFHRALEAVLEAIPPKWRRSRVAREDLDRFLFEPEDVIVALGQDGLVANVAKYLEGQPVVGVNPLPERYDGILVPHAPEAAPDLIRDAAGGRATLESRTMVEARLDDGQQLLALNEIFVGHRTHQSARYRLVFGEQHERQSSSGLIVSTGTGATGWARSIHLSRGGSQRLPGPTERALAFFVREAFPSVATGVTLTDGLLRGKQALEIVSEMNEAGVVFGDGIEDDHLDFAWGQTARVALAKARLALVR